MSDKYPGGFVTTGAPAGFSVAFDGSGDYLSAANNVALNVGSGDFCIEAWFNIGTTASQQVVLSNAGVGGGDNTQLDIYLGNVRFASSTTVWLTSSNTVTTNTWNHAAACRSGTTLSLFVNGVRQATTTNSTNFANALNRTFNIGRAADASGYLTGYISNARVVKGTAVYDPTATTINVPTQLFPVTNTSLLTCQSPTIIDNSTNAFALTVGGDAKVSNFTPFAGYTGFNPALGAAAPGVWTLDEAAYYQNNRQWPIYDPYFKQTTLMLHGNSQNNQSTWIKDASTNNFALTVVSTAKAEAQSPFSKTTYPTSGSGYFNGSSDYLTWTGTTFGTSDYTLEFWAYKTSSWTDGFDFLDAATSGLALYVSSGTMAVTKQNTGGAAVVLGSLTSLSINTWYHFAIIRSSGSVRCYVNGSPLQAAVSDANNYSVATTKICGTGDGYYDGYISNMRLATSALYSIAGSTITVPTEPLTAVSGTQLLTLQNSQPTANSSFTDSSTNNFAITRNGNTTQGTFTPFSQTGWSNYFNGTTDFLSLTTTSALTLGTNSFTVEYFYYVPDTVGGQGRISWGAAGSPNIYLGTGALVTYTNFATSVLLTSSIPCTANAWNHIAVVRNSGTTRIYINGVLGGSVADTTNWSIGSGTFRIMSSQGTDYSSGYVSNLRIVNGSAVYTSNFTPPTSPLTAITNTVLLTCQDNRFRDNSAINYTITPNGSASVQAFSPFVPTVTTPTTYSNWFDGNSDFLSFSPGASFAFGTGAFTVEAWVNLNVTPTANYIIDARNSGQTSNWAFGFGLGTSARLGFYDSSTTLEQSSTTVSSSGWYHCVAVRSGTTLSVFINGTRVATGTNSTNLSTSPTTSYIGEQYNGANYMNGCLSNVRVVKGTAVYDPTQTTLTVPTAPLTNITNTSLLTCQSSTFIDNSTNAFTITATGNVQPVASPTPFPALVDQTTLNTAYNAPLIGGSAYFDGSGDYLQFTDNTNIFNGNFTAECWFYRLGGSAGDHNHLLGNSSTSTSGFYWAIREGGSGLAFQVYLNGAIINYTYSTSQIPIGAWTHLAIVKSSSTITGYINGIAIASATVSDATSGISSTYLIGRGATSGAWSNQYVSGYISSYRLSTVARTISIPTAPLTAIANTEFLANFTNAAIIDNTSKTIWETVGNAQISTTQSKYGGSSMYFDGTGDYLLPAPTAATQLALGTGDFTIEMWFRVTTTAAAQVLIDFRPTSTDGVYPLIYISASGTSVILDVSAGARITGTTTISTNTWYHLAVCRASSQTRMFVNGIQVGSTYADTNNYLVGTTRPVIGSGGFTLGVNPLTGYIDDLRVTKAARYTTNFTPPTSQLQDQ